jgi:tetratricopeptide (TPR) repeat protein
VPGSRLDSDQSEIRGGQVSLHEQVTPYMLAAVRTYGGAALTADVDTSPNTGAALGQRLLLEIFGAQAARGQLPALVAALIADVDDPALQDALEIEVYDAMYGDNRLEIVARETMIEFLRRQIEAGSAEAMVRLGDLLRWQGDLDGASVACRQAFDSGDAHAMIDLARLLRGDLGDGEGARAALQQAIDSADAEVALEAMVDLGHLLKMFHRDPEGARSAFEQAIGSGHRNGRPWPW